MDIKAKTTYVRMSPTKVRDIANRLSGLAVTDAFKLIQFSERKGAVLLRKTLKAAIANAVNNAKLPEDGLFVREAIIEKGPSMRRYWPRSRGMARPIEKKMCHIRITLTDKAPAAKKVRKVKNVGKAAKAE